MVPLFAYQNYAIQMSDITYVTGQSMRGRNTSEISAEYRLGGTKNGMSCHYFGYTKQNQREELRHLLGLGDEEKL